MAARGRLLSRLRLGGAVLCGGASSRMGTDKALVEIAGVAMAVRVASALTAGGAETVIAVGGDADGLARVGLRTVPDRWPGEGPLGGIVTALASIDADIVVVLACDVRQASGEAVRALVAALTVDPAVDVTVPVIDAHRRFDHLALRREAAFSPLEDAFEQGIRSIRDGLSRLTVDEVAGLDRASLLDADTFRELPLG